MSSATTYTSATSESRDINDINWKRFALVGLATVIAAVAANTLFYYIASVFVTYDSEFIILTNAGGTILFTLFSAFIAVLVYAGHLRFAGNPARTFTIVAAVVFVLSLIPTATMLPSEPGASNGQLAVLMLMHAAAALVIVAMLTILTRQPSR